MSRTDPFEGSAKRPGPAGGAARGFVLPLLAVLAACSSTPEAPREPAVFYPSPPDPPRIQFLRSVSMDADIEPGRSGLDTILFGRQELNRVVMAPYGSVVRDGLVYVCDIQQGAILTFDFEGRKLDYVHASGRAGLQKPVNLEFAPDGTLYVADVGRNQVVVLGPDLRYQAEFGPFGEKSRPVDVALSGDELYVVDGLANCVRVLDRHSGAELRVLGGDPDSPQRLSGPTNIALGEDGTVYVVETIQCRVSVMDAQGVFLRHIGSPGYVVGQFTRPKGITVFGNILFVIDAAFENCQIFDLRGNPLMFFGGSGVGPGHMYLPAGVWVGKEGLELFKDSIEEHFEAEGLIIVTNLYGPRKVNFYAFGKSRDFEYPADEESPVYVPPGGEPADADSKAGSRAGSKD